MKSSAIELNARYCLTVFVMPMLAILGYGETADAQVQESHVTSATLGAGYPDGEKRAASKQESERKGSERGESEKLLLLAQRDPVALLALALRRCERDVVDYRCFLTKQERINGKLGPRQVIRVLLQEKPKRILMTWIRNAGRVQRALYIAGGSFDWRGREMFEVVPSGNIARAIMGTVRVPVRCSDRSAQGLGTIDELGFRSMLRQILDCTDKATALDDLSIRFSGEGVIDGRPTLIIERVIRRPRRIGPKAAARLVLHIDQEWLLPVSVQCYEDPRGRRLTRSYVFTNVRLNPGLSAGRFVLDGQVDANARQLLAERR